MNDVISLGQRKPLPFLTTMCNQNATLPKVAIRMGRATILTAALIVALTGFPTASKAQTGFTKPVGHHDDASLADLPTINGPKPEWTAVLDIYSSDGTAAVPSCGDPNVIASVRDGIVESINDKFEASGGSELDIKKADLGTVWVHPAFSGRFVCDMDVRVDLPLTGAEEWKFETYASDGRVSVFFMDVDSQH